MTILVTGGAGYIGTHTCVELLLAGQDVAGAGVHPSAISGVLAAGAIDRSVLRLMA